MKAPFVKESGEDPFLEGGARASERGRHPREGETAHVKLEKQEKKKKGGEGPGESSPEPSTQWGGDDAEISQGGARLEVLWISGL